MNKQQQQQQQHFDDMNTHDDMEDDMGDIGMKDEDYLKERERQMDERLDDNGLLFVFFLLEKLGQGFVLLQN